MWGAVGFLARSQQRLRWRALIVITLFVALVGGSAIALVAGSRRSASVVRRYYASGIPYTTLVYAPDGASITAASLRHLPGVVRADEDTYVAFVRDDGKVTATDGVNAVAVSPRSLDPTIRVLQGSLARFGTPDEVAVNEFFVKQFGVRVGDRMRFKTFGRDQYDEVNAGEYSHPHGPVFTFRIGAVVRTPEEIGGDKTVSVQNTSYASRNAMFVPTTFYDAHAQDFLTFGRSYDVQLRDGRAGMSRLRTQLHRLEPELPQAFGAPRFQARRQSLDSPVDVETVGLLALGIGIAVAGAVASVLLIRAEQRGHDRETPTLRALGYANRELGAAAAVRYAPVALGGALLAALVAVVLSSRFPVGIGHELELERGTTFNVAVLAIGAVACALLVLASAFVSARVSRPLRDRMRRRGAVAAWEARAGAPPAVSLGTHFAFDRGRGARGFEPRQAIAAGGAALAIVVAVSLLGGSVDRLYATPSERGWPWDIAIGNVNFTLTAAQARAIQHDRDVRAATIVRYGIAQLDGRDGYVLATVPGGTAPPSVVRGRRPLTRGEIALGERQMRHLHTHIGDNVTLSVANGDYETDAPPKSVRLRVVGTAAGPLLGDGDLGDVAVVSMDAIRAAGGATDPQIVLARLRGDPSAAAASLHARYTQEMLRDTVPARILNLHRVRVLPLLGLVFAGVIGIVVLAFALTLGARAPS
jgi:hypothetical protein